MYNSPKKQLLILLFILMLGIGGAIYALFRREENATSLKETQVFEQNKKDIDKESETQLNEIDSAIKAIDDVDKDITDLSLQDVE